MQDHMKKIWQDIGFVPSSIDLPANKEDTEENDQPLADIEKFPKKDTTTHATEEVQQSYVGLTISNVSLDLGDEEIKKFVAEYVSEEVLEEHISIHRD